VGKGRALHFGGTFERDNVDAMLKYLGVRAPWADVIRLDEDCELAVRGAGDATFCIVLNYGWQEARIELNRAVTDVDDGAMMQGEITLRPFETKVYRL